MLSFNLPSIDESFKCTGYATVCIVCFKRITEYALQKCSGCKLVFYCSKEHQKIDWKKHKKLCTVVQSMVRTTNSVGLYDDYANVEFDKWDQFRMSLIFVVQKLLKRELSRIERSLFLNPFACKVCHLHRTSSMITCKKCCIVSYCSVEHEEKDKLQHYRVCDKLKLCLDYDSNCHMSFSVSGCISDVTELSVDMQQFIDSNVSIKSKPHIDQLYTKCFVSNTLTIPLTIMYIIEKSKYSLEKQNLTIHLLGSSTFEHMAWWCWEYIFHYFTQLMSLNIVLIGPESTLNILQPILSCQDCINSRKLLFSTSPKLYHHYVNSNTVRPDIIVAFNCGFHELYKESLDTRSWEDSIQLICSFLGAVVAFTSYLEVESQSDLAIFKAYSNNKNIEVLVECQSNPYKSLIPFHDWYSEDSGVFYNNNFINIVSI